MQDRSYSLDELADMTGLKQRTIRHYIQQGLLLGPDSLGRNASYRDYHVKRLQVIKQLRRLGQSIEEIRQHFDHARPDEEIRVVGLSQAPMPEDMSDPLAEADPDSAFDFIRSRQGSADQIRFSAKPGHSPRPATPVQQLLEQLRDISTSPGIAHRTRGEQWIRLAVTPDLELNVRGPISPEQQKVYEQIADHIRHVLLGGEND